MKKLILTLAILFNCNSAWAIYAIKLSDLQNVPRPPNPIRVWGVVTNSSPVKISDGKTELIVNNLTLALDLEQKELGYIEREILTWFKKSNVNNVFINDIYGIITVKVSTIIIDCNWIIPKIPLILTANVTYTDANGIVYNSPVITYEFLYTKPLELVYVNNIKQVLTETKYYNKISSTKGTK